MKTKVRFVPWLAAAMAFPQLSAQQIPQAPFAVEFIVGNNRGRDLPLQHDVTIDTRMLPPPLNMAPLVFPLDQGGYRLLFEPTNSPNTLKWTITHYHVRSSGVLFAGIEFGRTHFYLDPQIPSTGYLNTLTGHSTGTQNLLVSNNFLGGLGFGLVPLEVSVSALFRFFPNNIVCVAQSDCLCTVPAMVPVLGGAPALAHCAGCGKAENPPPPPADVPKFKVNRQNQSDYKYPFGPGGTGVNLPLGPINPPRVVPQQGTLYGFAFEVVFPGGTKDCPNHIHQYIKDTVTFGDGTVERHPPPSPGDPGGFDSKNWAPDPPPDGTKQASLQTNADGTKSYLDSPGVIVLNRFLPVKKTTKFRWVLHDCNHNELDCREAEYTLEVDRNGNYVTVNLTAPQKCK